MSEKKQSAPVTHKPPPPEKQNLPNNVVSISSVLCKSEGCKKKHTKASFCDEHYEWFKMGLITLEGYKAKDYDKKYSEYLRRKAG